MKPPVNIWGISVKDYLPYRFEVRYRKSGTVFDKFQLMSDATEYLESLVGDNYFLLNNFEVYDNLEKIVFIPERVVLKDSEVK